MISAALMLFANTLLFSLRLERGGSFPRPLSAAEERDCLDRLAQGDPEARNIKGVQLSLETLTAAAQKDEAAQAVPMTNAERAELLREMIENGFIDADESGT